MSDRERTGPTGITLSDGVVTLRPWLRADAEAIFAAISESRAEL